MSILIQIAHVLNLGKLESCLSCLLTEDNFRIFSTDVGIIAFVLIKLCSLTDDSESWAVETFRQCIEYYALFTASQQSFKSENERDMLVIFLIVFKIIKLQ